MAPKRTCFMGPKRTAGRGFMGPAEEGPPTAGPSRRRRLPSRRVLGARRLRPPPCHSPSPSPPSRRCACAPTSPGPSACVPRDGPSSAGVRILGAPLITRRTQCRAYAPATTSTRTPAGRRRCPRPAHHHARTRPHNAARTHPPRPPHGHQQGADGVRPRSSPRRRCPRHHARTQPHNAARTHPPRPPHGHQRGADGVRPAGEGPSRGTQAEGPGESGAQARQHRDAASMSA